MTASDHLQADLFDNQLSSTVSCISSNVGSITDFLLTSTHSTINNDEQVLENSNREDISICENEPMNELNISGNREKLGHRRVDEIGNVTYKRVMVDDLMKSLQIGLNYVIGKHHQPQRPVLIQDFQQIEYQDFPPEGSKSTPKHPYSEFRLKTYAQTAFRFFRKSFGVDPSSFILSLCAKDLRELPNPGASGSIFYLTSDDTYIIKTVSKKEARFLLSLLPGYYMNLTQNPFTLLPKFFGLYCYQSSNKNIRFVIMNNLVPTNVKLHEKYDLKGSIYKRKASDEERKRDLPTLKDNDFKCLHSYGLTLEPFFYDQLMQTIEDDVRVLGSFGIMDYSFLLAAHNITETMKSTHKLSFVPSRESTSLNEPISSDIITNRLSSIHEEITTTSTDSGITMTTISKLPTYIQYLRVIEFIRTQQESSTLNIERSLSINHDETSSIQTVKPELSPILDKHFEQISQSNEDRSSSTNITRQMINKSPINHSNSISSSFHMGNGLIGGDVWYNRQNLSRLAMAGIPAVNKNGDLLLLYVGIIDILQNYRLRKKLEHAFKSTLVTREEISVCNPSHYGDRFVRFLSHKVFRKGGPNGNTVLSDSHSNTDRNTVHSSRLLNSSSLYHSQLSDDDNSSIINNNNEMHSIKS
ncbi:unnamed protein product [Adineta steineri]|uniref:PIPK domain-containing protein n=1 Tax=Adineta steineri TaxID=433720 RepID=A0A814FM51_9BILA|nr:unnamed protein product [Adineta steineri]CAF1155076.1 unnamed protein product [Adineta steineri]